MEEIRLTLISPATATQSPKITKLKNLINAGFRPFNLEECSLIPTACVYNLRFVNFMASAITIIHATAMKNGVLAGYPLDSLKVTLVDGSFHPVDSDQLSFEICAIQAYKNACSKAGPVLMEPIMKLEVVTPEENMGDVIGDLNKRRGQVEGMESSRSGARIVKAMVPLAEMFGYVTALRTITSGRATSSMVYSHHAQVSTSIAKAVLEEVKGRADLL